eukprot:3343863-Prymnesium_polylepis.1
MVAHEGHRGVDLPAEARVVLEDHHRPVLAHRAHEPAHHEDLVPLDVNLEHAQRLVRERPRLDHRVEWEGGHVGDARVRLLVHPQLVLALDRRLVHARARRRVVERVEPDRIGGAAGEERDHRVVDPLRLQSHVLGHQALDSQHAVAQRSRRVRLLAA